MPSASNNRSNNSSTQQSSNGSDPKSSAATITTRGNNHEQSSSNHAMTTQRNNNMRRCREMIQYQAEIATLQTKLHALQQEQEHMGRLAALQTCQNPSMAAYLWSSQLQNNKQERWNKDIVLALLQCNGGQQQKANSSSNNTTTTQTSSSRSRTTTETTTTTHLPVPLRMHKWDRKVPRHLRHDRDICLARLQRHDLFGGIPTTSTSTSTASSASSPYCSSSSPYCSPLLLLTIPGPLQNDLSVVLATIRRCPDVLLRLVPTVVLQTNSSSSNSTSRKQQQQQAQQQQQQQSLLNLHADSHIEILQTLLEAFRHHNSNSNSNSGSSLSMRTSTTRQVFFNHFSTLVVRDNPTVMMQVWQEWVLPGHVQVNETLFGPVLQNDKTFALQLVAAAAAVVAAVVTNDDKNTTTTNMPNITTTFPANALCALSKTTLQVDPDVVLAYCTGNGQNFCHISKNCGLQHSWQVIKAASLQNPSIVLSHLSPLTKKRLHWTKAFLLQLFDRLVEINKSSGNDTSSSSTTTTTTDAADTAAANVVWDYCSPELRRDRQVIMAALRAGAEMHYLLQSLSSLSSDLAATTTTTTTTTTGKNNNVKSSNNNKQRQQGRNNNNNNNNNTAISTTAIPSFLLEQRDLWADLICSGHLPWNDLPKTLKRDMEFAIACLLHHENNVNNDTNRHHQQSQQQLCQQQKTIKPLGTEMVKTILDHCPHVVTDPRMVVAWIQHYHGAVCSCSSLSGFFYATTTGTPVATSCRVACPCLDMYIETLPLSTRQNKSYMLRACRVNAAVILYLPVTLREDRDIVECVLLHSSCPSSSSSRGQRPLTSLQYVSAMAQHLYPDLVAQAIRQLPKPPSFTDFDEVNGFYNDPKGNAWSIWDIYDDVDEDLWVNREIALAWVERGGAYLHDDFPEDFENDAELFLEIAASPNNWDDFMFASEALLSDKDFMTKAVQRNGRVLKEARNGLDKDFDLALIAFAHTENLVNHYNWKCPEVISAGASTTTSTTGGGPGCSSSKNVGGDFVFLVDFAKHVRTGLMYHESFVEFLLCIQLSRPTATPTVTTLSSNSNKNNRRHNGNGGSRRRGSGGGGEREAVTSRVDGGGGGGRGKRHRGNKQEQTAPPPSGGGIGQNGNSVHLLAQGTETTLGFTKLVAAYMGIPTGQRLHLLRRASTNLARWGF